MQIIAADIVKVEVDVSGKSLIDHYKLVYDYVDSTSPACMKPYHIIDRCWSEIKTR